MNLLPLKSFKKRQWIRRRHVTKGSVTKRAHIQSHYLIGELTSSKQGSTVEAKLFNSVNRAHEEFHTRIISLTNNVIYPQNYMDKDINLGNQCPMSL